MNIINKNTLALVSLLFVLLILAAPNSANAHVYKYCEGNRPLKWKTNFMQLQIEKFHFAANANPRAPENIRQSLLDAIAAWNQAPGVDFRIGVNYRASVSTRKGFNTKDNINSVSINSFPDMGDALAVSTKQWRCGRSGWIIGPVEHFIDETDIFFNPSHQFTNSPYLDISETQPTTTSYNLGLVALHEIGHSMGLDHDDGIIQSMNSVYPNGGPLGKDGFGPDSIKPHAKDLWTARLIYSGGNETAPLELSKYSMVGNAGSAPNAQQVQLPAEIAQNDNETLTPISVTFENRSSTYIPAVNIQLFLTETPPIRNNNGTVTFGQKVYTVNTRTGAPVAPPFITKVHTLNVLFSAPVGEYYLIAEITDHGQNTPSRGILLAGGLADGRIRITRYPQNLIIPALTEDECLAKYSFYPERKQGPAYLNCMRNAIKSRLVHSMGGDVYNWVNNNATVTINGGFTRMPDSVDFLVGRLPGTLVDATLIQSLTSYTVESRMDWKTKTTRAYRKFTIAWDTKQFPDGLYNAYGTGRVGTEADTYSIPFIIDNTPPIITNTTKIGDKTIHGKWYENMKRLNRKDGKLYYNGKPARMGIIDGNGGSRFDPLDPPRQISGTWDSGAPAFERTNPGPFPPKPLPVGTTSLMDYGGNKCTPVVPPGSAGTFNGEEIICN